MKKKLKELGNIGTGTTPSMKHSEFYDSADIMFIKPSDFKNNEVSIIKKTESYLSNKARDKARLFPAGTVLCTCIGNIGKIALVMNEASCNQQNNYIIPNDNVVPKFLAYSLLSQKNKMEIMGSNAPIVPIINKTEFSNVEIPFYESKEDQKRIAAELDTIQSAIDNKKQQLSLLDEAVKSEFVEMFGENPVESRQWKVEKLGNLGNLKNGMNFSPTEIGFDLFCVNVSDFQDYYKIKDCKKLSLISLNSIPADDYFLYNEDIVFVRSNGNKKLVGRCIAVYPNDLKVTFSGFCIRFRKIKNEVITDFLLHYLKTDIAREKMKGKGANIQNLNQQILNNVDIPIPPLELQNKFAAFVQQIDKLKIVVKQQITDLQELLDSKMQEYFGE